MRTHKFVGPLLILGLIGVLFWEIPRLIIIKKITCTSQFGPCPAQVETSVAKARGKSLEKAKTAFNIELKQNGVIGAFSFQYRIPDELLINIILKKPKFALKIDGNYVLVDRDGVVIGMENAVKLPYLTVAMALPKIGEKVPEDKLFALSLLSSLNSLYQTEAGQITDNSLVVELPLGQTVLFPLGGDRDVLIGSLRLILGSYAGAGSIDLRFKNPVVK